MGNCRWSNDENEFLVAKYIDANKDELIHLFPGRTWVAIKLHANSLGLYRSLDRESTDVRSANLEPLLNNTPNAYYWMGFLLADAHFTQTRVTLHLAQKDISQVLKFGEFINYKGGINSSHIAIAHARVIRDLRLKFGIHNNKTYSPSSIDWIVNDDLFVALVVGFIDGDGSIGLLSNRSDFSIRIKCHSSWLYNLQYISDRISALANVPSVVVSLNKEGYALLQWGNTSLSKWLKRQVIRMNIPVMARKWNIINLDYVSRQELGKFRKEKIMELKCNGYRNKDIACLLGVTEYVVSSVIYRLKKESNFCV